MIERLRIDRLRTLGARPVDIILLDPLGGHDRRLSLTPRMVCAALLGALLCAVSSGWALYAFTNNYVDAELAAQWRTTLDAQQEEIARLQQEADSSIGAMTRRFGELQARLLRMEALGEQVASAAKLDPDEFVLDAAPALGGPAPDADDDVAVEPPRFVSMIDDLSEQVLAREQQLLALESLLGVRRFEAAVAVEGRPVRRGWLSSSFGRRVDPFTGRLANHKGVDFAGAEGDPVIAVASGIVVNAEYSRTFGHLIEVNHGNGYMTRYAHNASLEVAVGDLVLKGDVIARMGSTGRSTGPHVHFEVLRDGEQLDPMTFIARQ